MSMCECANVFVCPCVCVCVLVCVWVCLFVCLPSDAVMFFPLTGSIEWTLDRTKKVTFQQQQQQQQQRKGKTITIKIFKAWNRLTDLLTRKSNIIWTNYTQWENRENTALFFDKFENAFFYLLFQRPLFRRNFFRK